MTEQGVWSNNVEYFFQACVLGLDKHEIYGPPSPPLPQNKGLLPGGPPIDPALLYAYYDNDVTDNERRNVEENLKYEAWYMAYEEIKTSIDYYRQVEIAIIAKSN